MSKNISSDSQNTNQDESSPISKELDSLACDAIGMALDKLAIGEGIWPTLMIENAEGAREYFVFEDDGLDVCLIEARSSVKTLGKDAVCYALYYDGFFQNDERLSDNALIVEFGERGAKTAYSAIIAYGNSGMYESFWYDAPIPGGEEELLF